MNFVEEVVGYIFISLQVRFSSFRVELTGFVEETGTRQPVFPVITTFSLLRHKKGKSKTQEILQIDKTIKITRKSQKCLQNNLDQMTSSLIFELIKFNGKVKNGQMNLIRLNWISFLLAEEKFTDEVKVAAAEITSSMSWGGGPPPPPPVGVFVLFQFPQVFI